MGRELLDRKAERVRWQIAHAFAQWATCAAIRSQGKGGNNFPKKQEDVNRYLESFEFASLFDVARGLIDEREFHDCIESKSIDYNKIITFLTMDGQRR